MRLHTPVLLYQLFSALSDAGTGIALLAAPALTLHMMGTAAPTDAMPYLRYIGAFVLSTGLACGIGAWAVRYRDSSALSTIWLLTAVTRTLVALCVTGEIAAGSLDPHWSTVAVFDGALALLQFLALAKGWHRRACLD
jgi:hypothetical protein